MAFEQCIIYKLYGSRSSEVNGKHRAGQMMQKTIQMAGATENSWAVSSDRESRLGMAGGAQ